MAYGLFEALGIEIEYMLVDAATLSVDPIADRLLAAAGDDGSGEVDRGSICWSNELVAHVIELKTCRPVRCLTGCAAAFAANVRDAATLLEPLGARLMPTGMHPWMDSARETRLWPHEAAPIYQAFDRIFDCRRPGWANLQSVHLNLPFADDEEFGRLHAAVRMLLPLMPALAASSPVSGGRRTGVLDTRLLEYRRNAARFPSVTGHVIPERVFDRAGYEREILARIYAELAPLDPEGVLRHEWVNARGCIARFERNTIEIRVLDVQECPLADVAVVLAVVSAVRAAVEGRLGDPRAHRRWSELELERILLRTIRDADRTLLDEPAYLAALGLPGGERVARRVWQEILERTDLLAADAEVVAALEEILARGSLATRIDRALGRGGAAGLDAERCRVVYQQLCDCLERGVLFVA